MNKLKSGFILMEAILTVLIASICLTFITQSLLTNFRTDLRYQETVRALTAMENRLGLLYATTASEDLLNAAPLALEAPYEDFSAQALTKTINSHLEEVRLQLNWPAGQAHNRLVITTAIYNPNGNYAANQTT
ncbi:MAG: hypothetical protein KGK03_07670 [Candidatus Omnitrophica bacterium]|nr:hypothetical protein [Candidatus Omnitrophota bacterium]